MSLVLASLLALFAVPVVAAPFVAAPLVDGTEHTPSAPAAPALMALVPADALAVAVLGDLAGSIDRVLHSQIWERLRAGPLGQRLEDASALQKLRVAQGVVLGATGLEWDAALSAVSGDGIVGVLLPGHAEGAEPAAVLMLGMTDSAAFERGLRTFSVFLPKEARPPAGSSWRIPLGDSVLERRENLLLLADSRETLDRVRKPASKGPQGLAAAVSRASGQDALVWATEALLNADGQLPAKLDNLGTSLLVGQWHAVLSEAAWISASLALSSDVAQLTVSAPADAEALSASHGAFFPPAGEASLPQLDSPLAELVAQRDLGEWWNGRDAFLSERGMADSIEPDGNLSLLFQRDLGADILAWLEPELLFVVARCETEGGQPEPVYPAAALGLVPKAGHPDDFRSAFVNAFFAVVSFTNFDNDGPSRPLLEPDLEDLPGGGRLYRARWRPWTGAGPAPARYNLSPSLLLAEDGRLWLSTAEPLLRRLAAAPSRQRAVDGWSLTVDLTEGAEMLLANHDALLAGQLLKSGGDFSAAQETVAAIEAAAALFDEFSVEARLASDDYTLRAALSLR